MGQYALNAVWSRVAADPVAKKALIKRFNDPREIDRRVSAGDDSAFDGEYLSDILCDLLSSEGRLYRRFMARGSEWNYPIDIRGLGGVYFVSAPEFDDIGYFLSLEDAEDEVISNWSGSLVSKKGRTYRPPFASEESANTAQPTPSAVATTATEDRYQVDHELERAISKALSEPTAVGSYSETVDIDGRSVIYRFSQATGLAWQRCRTEYRKRFGSDVPAWVLREHPHHRSCLCELSLKRNLALPASRPLEGTTKSGVEKR